MHCLFFDVVPKAGKLADYFTHVDVLKPRLERHKGLIYLERFRPLDDPDALLSHQLWKDEGAIDAWRRDSSHQQSQIAGRREIFQDYRIRVGQQALERPGSGNLAGTGNRYIVASYGNAVTAHGGRAYESITRPDFFVTLGEATDPATATDLAERAVEGGAETVRVFAVHRDYSMTERNEAPQIGKS
ncbi:antibiotic biosynthesis monooxygenase family protein [Primorskyibacter sp. S87]|uniref:antibiotic biosynthesis monooxygenase family protein n=1 Tax=Primorskyibacter sp. S87 TaxID=3415126 RepID=UPI003C7B11D0